MDFEKVASCCLGVRIYCRKAVLFHLPSIRIVESSKPTLAAVVAAPIRKLWPANCDSGSPIAYNAALTCCVNVAFVSGFPFLNLRNGP